MENLTLMMIISYEMIMGVRFCLSYDLLNVILLPSKFISMKNCIIFTDVVMLLVPTESVM